jgi:pyruvate formate lyase activating enzyme
MVRLNDTEGVIFKIKRFALHDGPGLRTTVFLKGCPLNCTWCHSPEGISHDITIWYDANSCIACGECVSVCPENALKLSGDNNSKIVIDRIRCQLSGNCVTVCPTTALQYTGYVITTRQVLKEIEKDIIYYRMSGGGVTLTGGEPLAQADFSSAILRECRKRDIHTAVETCLFSERDALKKVADYVDLFIVDLKIFDSVSHKYYTGKANEQIKDNFRFIAGLGKDIIVRIPMVEGITATYDNLKAIKNFVSEVNNKIPVENIKFNPLAVNNYRKLDIPFLLT